MFTLLLLLGIAGAAAQHRDGKTRQQMFKEIQEFKIRFIAQEIELQDDQKQRFTELYTEMSDKRHECMRSAWRMERKLKKMENPTEADYQAATEAISKAKAEDAQIEKTYSEKFAQILTPKQMFKMKEAEEKFRQKMEEMRRKGKNKDKK